MVPVSDGVDWWPAGKCADLDNDTYSAVVNTNCPHDPVMDCNDSNPGISPGNRERCSNDVDDNCDGQSNEGCRKASSPLFRKQVEVTAP